MEWNLYIIYHTMNLINNDDGVGHWSGRLLQLRPAPAIHRSTLSITHSIFSSTHTSRPAQYLGPFPQKTINSTPALMRRLAALEGPRFCLAGIACMDACMCVRGAERRIPARLPDGVKQPHGRVETFSSTGIGPPVQGSDGLVFASGRATTHHPCTETATIYRSVQRKGSWQSPQQCAGIAKWEEGMAGGMVDPRAAPQSAMQTVEGVCG